MSKVLKQEQFEKQFLEIKIRTLPIITSFNVPVRSGDLKNSFQYNNLGGTGFEITTNLYYMPFTNEEWVSPRWKGRKNPNYKWFEANGDYIGKAIARHLGGKYVRVK